MPLCAFLYETRARFGRVLVFALLSCALGLLPRAWADSLAVPELSSWIVDEAQVLTPEQRQALDQVLRQFEQQKGAQIFMLTIPSLEGEDIDSYAVRVFEDWGVGRQSTDDGVLLVAAIEDRKLRIEVGYGLEGVIPDIVAGRIIREQVAPAFQQEAYAQGLMAAATQLMQRIEGEDLPAPEQSQGGVDEYDGPEGFEIVIIVAILFGFAFLVPPVPAAAAVGIFIFIIFEALGWAVGAAMVAFLISSVGSLWRFGPDSDTRYATGNRSTSRRRHDHWGGGGGFGGGGGIGGGGMGGGGASGGGGSSGGGGASGGW
ncbi:MAG TPA: YgcG family protein [Paenalcaligenes sp.]|nr:YgcG family protein [Paenalcaligenes sp.]